MGTRHFLTLLDYNPEELRALLARAIELKKMTFWLLFYKNR